MGTKYLRIEGEALVAVEEIVHRRTTLPEWLAAMNKLSPVSLTSPVLPEGTVLYAQKGTQQLLAINQPAGVKKVVWRTGVYRDSDQRAKTRWQIAVPPHVFLLVFNHDAIYSTHIYYTPKPVTSDKDMLFCTNLANVYFQPQSIPNPICSGTIRLNAKDPLAARCQTYINGFWESEFNDDIPPQVLYQRGNEAMCVFVKDAPKELVNLNAWEAATLESPDFLSKMDWPFTPTCTLADILNERWQTAS